MRTKKLLTLAIIAALPFGAIAENISGAMYAAPAHADTNHPAPTTNAYAPYGRIDIDTTDQDHIASTAYVKGAYNSVIAAINRLDDSAQLMVYDPGQDDFVRVTPIVADDFDNLDSFTFPGQLVSGKVVENAIADVNTTIDNKRVTVYTTWEDDTDNGTTQVTLSTAD